MLEEEDAERLELLLELLILEAELALLLELLILEAELLELLILEAELALLLELLELLLELSSELELLDSSSINRMRNSPSRGSRAGPGNIRVPVLKFSTFDSETSPDVRVSKKTAS